MVKIKQKKQLNLPQLIEWAWENEIKNKRFIHSDSNPPEYVWVNENSEIEFDEDMILRKNNTFTVEVEEEITLTTPLPAMLHVWKTGILGTEIKEVENKSIASQYTVCSTEFWLKQDDEMTLIWRDGRLIKE